MQHLFSEYRGEDVEHEAASQDLLQRDTEGPDVRPVAARRVSEQDRSAV
jgi:hypothetical protein